RTVADGVGDQAASGLAAVVMSSVVVMLCSALKSGCLERAARHANCGCSKPRNSNLLSGSSYRPTAPGCPPHHKRRFRPSSFFTAALGWESIALVIPLAREVSQCNISTAVLGQMRGGTPYERNVVGSRSRFPFREL